MPELAEGRDFFSIPVTEWDEYKRKVDTIHDFVLTLQMLGSELATSNNPMVATMRAVMPSFGG